jgi:hypothetical protein
MTIYHRHIWLENYSIIYIGYSIKFENRKSYVTGHLLQKAILPITIWEIAQYLLQTQHKVVLWEVIVNFRHEQIGGGFRVHDRDEYTLVCHVRYVEFPQVEFCLELCFVEGSSLVRDV